MSLHKEAGPAATHANARQLLDDAKKVSADSNTEQAQAVASTHVGTAVSSSDAASQAPATAPTQVTPSSVDSADSQGSKKKSTGPPPGGYYSKMVNTQTQGAAGASVATAAAGDKGSKPAAADNTKKSDPKATAPSKVCMCALLVG